MTRSGLGKGLSALLPDDGETTGPEGLVHVAIDEIRPNPRQPRERFDAESIDVLADSIARVGVLQPLLVRRAEVGYELIAGERRLRAARRAGMDAVPVIVKDTSDEESLEQALLENMHRDNLNPLEEAAAFRQLIDDFALTHEAVAERVGKSRAAVSNALRLLALPPEVHEMLADGSLSGGHARALLSLDDPQRQVEVARRCVDEGWSVRQVEDAVRETTPTRGGSTPRGGGGGHPALLEVGDLIGEYLNTPVKLSMKKESGRMVVEFGSLEDLERITQLILGPFTQSV
ncbi:MAG: ParB/RepB/Spo0J family partition protein [Acidimicrobiia bacterium]|nr:ParB/RepB/Spo0J family partition protein [Acidimicrobiia bacterium]